MIKRFFEWLNRDALKREEESLNAVLRAWARIARLEKALREIEAMKTTHCAHIGKRMAKRAGEALR